MCLLIYTQQASSIPTEHFQNAFEDNPHGAGFCYVKDGEICIRKGYFTIAGFLNAIKEAGDSPAIIHFRLATHGLKNEANCHPFTAGGGWAMGHNGIIYDKELNLLPNESDTAAFVRQMVIPYTSQYSDVPTLKSFQDWWTEVIGYSKLVFLRGDGKYVIINEQLGHWSSDKLTWYSNCSYEESRKKFHHFQTGWDWEDQEEYNGYIPAAMSHPREDDISADIIDPVTMQDKLRKEKLLEMLCLKEQLVCSWCDEPLFDSSGWYSGGHIYTDQDGRCVCESCVHETIVDIPVSIIDDDMGEDADISINNETTDQVNQDEIKRIIG